MSKLRILDHMAEEGLMQPEDRDFFKKGVVKKRLKDIDAYIPPRGLLEKMALRRAIPKGGDYLNLVTAERYNQIRLVKEERTATEFDDDDPVLAGQAASLTSLQDKKNSMMEKRRSVADDLLLDTSNKSLRLSRVDSLKSLKSNGSYDGSHPPPPPGLPDPIPGAIMEDVDNDAPVFYHTNRKSEHRS